jgi:folate-binding protein YgfZ
MNRLALHEFHRALNAHFAELNGAEIVGDYGDPAAEHAALWQRAGVLDLSFRGRLCLTGVDRARFLHGQVTNDVNRLSPGGGCYAALVTAKGKMQSDLNLYCLTDELLLDFEPGLTETVTQRLEKYIVADDVQVVDIAAQYGLLTVQGPGAASVVSQLDLFPKLPAKPFESVSVSDATLGEIYLMNQPRLGSAGFDVFVPMEALAAVADRLIAAARSACGRACGWQAFETARIEAGIPRFGADMDENNFPLESGIESRAVSYTKGCYIGQEVINRIHTIGHVNKELRGMRLADDLKILPGRGDKLYHNGKETGYITSALKSPAANANLALGYVRPEASQIGTELNLRTAAGESAVRIVELPFFQPGSGTTAGGGVGAAGK